MTLFKKINGKSLCQITLFAIALNVAIGSLMPARAKPREQKKNSEYVVNTNQGLPSHRRDGGTRSSCASNSSSDDFVALIPDTAVNMTASAKPTLYFHVPKTEQSPKIEFVLRDENDRLVYETAIDTEGEAGIMSVEIPFPVRQKALQSNTEYHWYLSQICNPQKRSQDIVLEGWIQHQVLSPQTQQQIANFSLRERANFYQQQGLWYDALAVAATELETEVENNSQTQWSKFLNAIGLDKFADKPLIERAK